MQPALYPLDLYRGDTLRLTVRLWQDTAKTQPMHLDGAQAKAEIRTAPGGPSLLVLSCTVQLPNLVLVAMTAEQSKRAPLTGAWDCQVTFASGDIRTVLAGPVTTTADVTDALPPGTTTGCTPMTGTPTSSTPVPAGTRARF